MNIIKLFMEIYRKEGLRYFMIGGTMLGAIRHKGFIPWDDDVDIGMPREDYDRLFELLKDGTYLPENFSLADTGCPKLGLGADHTVNLRRR